MAARGAPKSPPDEGRPVAPSELRGRLATDLGEDYELLADTLRTAMSEGTKDSWLTCRQCGKKAVYAAPDHRTRLDAAQRWLELGLGRKREEVEVAKADLTAAKTAAEMRALSDAELYAIIAAGE